MLRDEGYLYFYIRSGDVIFGIVKSWCIGLGRRGEVGVAWFVRRRGRVVG